MYQPLALARMLPVRETNFLNDFVNVRDDALNDNMGVAVFDLTEEFGKSFPRMIAFRFWIDFSLRLDDLFGNLKNGLQKL